jgi:hypothetical protein
LFGSVGYFFYKTLFVKEEDFNKARREKLLAKRTSKKEE